MIFSKLNKIKVEINNRKISGNQQISENETTYF